MGFEIVYCAGCCNRLVDSDFERRRAIWIGDRAACSGCVRKVLAGTLAAPGQPIVLRRSRKLRAREG